MNWVAVGTSASCSSGWHRSSNFPTLQRWIGVNYRPQTEIPSHYGEMRLSKGYEMIAFVDMTQ